MKRWLSKLIDKYEAMRPAKRALVGHILTLVLVAAGAPVGIAALAGQVVAMAPTPAPVVVPVQVPVADPAADLLRGIVEGQGRGE